MSIIVKIKNLKLCCLFLAKDIKYPQLFGRNYLNKPNT